ncbi:ABC1 kinase family protein [Solicola gregarius]|uniref:AarF/UbiB family protein n=1 Tax=Solicola gregarius TaxID=2908642 RepID=A0AA46TLR1_9ACTN|nr:AarF/UbiB family protein [Solicola gregarius]UYM07627.1 AarF/UbiB family protein [Solicola gregarius]
MTLLVLPAAGITALVFTVVAGRAVRRLMGVDIGTVRMLLAGAVIISLQGPLIRSLAGGRYEDESVTVGLGLLLLSLAGSAVIAMIGLAIAEALVPSGSIAGPLTAWQRGRGSVARVRRYLRIARIVARHGLGPYVARRGRHGRTSRDQLARSLRLALEDGGAAFVKFGQLLSTRVDLLPEAFTVELALLRDRVPPAGWEAVEPTLRADLDDPEAFAWIDPEPLAAASIAQVHAAQLRDGSDVVLKIQRPGAAATMAADLDILSRLARCLQHRTAWASKIGLVALVDAYATALREEFDFELEAANALSIGASTARTSTTPPVRVPEVYARLSTKRVLVMERFRGQPIGRATGDDGRQVARSLLASVLDQILRDGVFHADPHQGNIVLLESGGVGLLDFGSVARIDAELRAGLRRLLLAVDRDDPRAATDALLGVVESPRDLDRVRLVREVGRCLMRHLGPGASAGAGLLVDLIRVLTRFGLRVPPEVAAAFRAVATLEGVLAQSVPGFDVVTEARDIASRVRMPAFEPADVRRELARVLPAIQEIPRTIERLGQALEAGKLTVRHEVVVDAAERARVRDTVHQVLAGAIGSALGFMALMLLQLPGGPQVSDRLDLHQLLGYGLLTTGALLVTRALVPIFSSAR